MKNWRLLKSLKLRGESTSGLASKIGSNRCHVSQVLNNIPGRGGKTRRKLAKLLTAEELALAGWEADGKLQTPSSKLQNGSTGNKVAV